jgi:hypothetical protein
MLCLSFSILFVEDRQANAQTTVDLPSQVEEPKNLSNQILNGDSQSSLSDEVIADFNEAEEADQSLMLDELPESTNQDSQQEAPGELDSLEPPEEEIEGTFDGLGEDEQEGESGDDEFDDDDLSVLADDSNDDSMQGLSIKPIDQISLSVQPSLPVPAMQQLPLEVYQPKPVSLKVYQWQADNVGYRNLVFEEPALERHGHVLPGQSLRSGIKFVGRAAFYPADLIKGHTKRCDNPLGWGQPGTCPR